LLTPTPFEPARSPTHRFPSRLGVLRPKKPRRGAGNGGWDSVRDCRDLRLKGSRIGDDTRTLIHPPLHQLPTRLGEWWVGLRGKPTAAGFEDLWRSAEVSGFDPPTLRAEPNRRGLPGRGAKNGGIGGRWVGLRGKLDGRWLRGASEERGGFGLRPTHPTSQNYEPEPNRRGLPGGTKTGGIIGMFSAAFSSPQPLAVRG
jgi:hypothetical protein